MGLPSTVTYVSCAQRYMDVKVLGPKGVIELINRTGVN